MSNSIVASVFCDGGVVDINPSPIGGTWSFLWSDSEGQAIFHASGAVEPADIDVDKATNSLDRIVTNPYTEL